MQPWENEKKQSDNKHQREKRTVREKIGLATHALTLTSIACGLIYGTLLYEFSKQIAFKLDPSLKK